MGLAGSDNRNLQDTLGIWGKDPVHSLDSAYATIAEKVLEEVNMASVVNAHHAVSPLAAREPVMPIEPRELDRSSTHCCKQNWEMVT